MSVTKHLVNKSESGLPPKSATRKLLKCGRKGNNIVQAFDNVPAIPVEFEGFAKKYHVSPKVLRQIKRFDAFKERGQVYVRKNKRTKLVMIWREIPIQSSENE